MTNPHFKQVYRIYDKQTNKALADLVTVYDEVIDETKPLEIFDPNLIHKRKTLTDFYVEKRLLKVIEQGKVIIPCMTLLESREHLKQELSHMWDEVLRFANPHKYYVDLSDKLWNIRRKLIEASTN